MQERGQARLPDLRDFSIDRSLNLESLSIKNQQLNFIKLKVRKAGLPPLVSSGELLF